MIRWIEGDIPTREPIVRRLGGFRGIAGSFVTSRLSRLECRVRPLRLGDLATLSQFDDFFTGVEVVLVEIGPSIVDRATELRARYGLRTPDAIHYATAIEVGAPTFLTADGGLTRCTEVPVELI